MNLTEFFTTDGIKIINDKVYKTVDISGIQEIAFYNYVSHPHILELSDAKGNITREKHNIFTVVTPLKKPCFPWMIAKIGVEKWFREILSAVYYLSTLDILHNDLKVENTVYDEKENKFLLMDFGLSTKTYACNQEKLGPSQTIAPEVYMSWHYPELLDEYGWSRSMTEKSEVFSLGSCLYIIFTGKDVLLKKRYAFDVYKPSQENVRKVIRNFLKKGLNMEKIPAEWRDLIGRMLQPRPEDRPSLDELRRMYDIPTYRAPKLINIPEYEYQTEALYLFEKLMTHDEKLIYQMNFILQRFLEKNEKKVSKKEMFLIIINAIRVTYICCFGYDFEDNFDVLLEDLRKDKHLSSIFSLSKNMKFISDPSNIAHSFLYLVETIEYKIFPQA